MATRRTEQLAGFIALLKGEGRHGVLGLDCGTGTDGLVFVRAGMHFTGVDASEENIHAARAHGLSASVAGGRALPFADAAFAAVWAVDVLAEVPPGERDDVLRDDGDRCARRPRPRPGFRGPPLPRPGRGRVLG
jgi:predicted TPR repeat methyltransferase